MEVKQEIDFMVDGDNDTPQVKKAHNAVNNALRDGRLKKPDRCQKCNKKTNSLGAHHYKGYDDENLLSVKWLCRTCHNEADKKSKKKKDSHCRIDVVDFVPIGVDEQGKNDIDAHLYEKMKRTPEGFLVGRAVVTNVGVFPYRMDDGSLRWELRPPEEVFNQDSLNSLKMKPITDNHPTEVVNSENVKRLGKGSLGEQIRTDAYRVSVPINITDAEAVESVNSGKRALSCGYTADIEEVSGVWMGVPYDAIQRNIRYNHTALVDRGRAGDAAVLKTDAALIMDSADTDLLSFGYQINQTKKQSEVKPMLKKIKLDNGVEYEAEEKVIDALHESKQKLDSANDTIKNLTTEKSTLEAKADTFEEENKKLKKDLEKAQEVSPQKIDEAIKARLSLISTAKKADIEVKDGMSEEDIKKAVILKAFPTATEKLEKADSVYIEARFDCALEYFNNVEEQEKKDEEIDSANKTKLTDDLSKKNDSEDSSESHRQKMIQDQQNAWKDEKGE